MREKEREREREREKAVVMRLFVQMYTRDVVLL